MTYMEKWVREHADVYLRHGGKTSRRRMVKRLIVALNDIYHYEGIATPFSVGRGQVYRYYVRYQDFSDRTLEDYYRAFCLLWELLGRGGSPPHPKSARYSLHRIKQ